MVSAGAGAGGLPTGAGAAHEDGWKVSGLGCGVAPCKAPGLSLTALQLPLGDSNQLRDSSTGGSGRGASRHAWPTPGA